MFASGSVRFRPSFPAVSNAPALIVAGYSYQHHRYICHVDLLECQYPIVYNGVPLGNFIYGQLRNPDDTPEGREKRFNLSANYTMQVFRKNLVLTQSEHTTQHQSANASAGPVPP